MRTYKTHGIAIRRRDLGEADRVVTFLTDDGRISAVARAIRKPKSKIGGRLEPGNDLELVITEGRTLDIITGVQVRKLRPWLREDLDKIEASFAVLEIADKLGETGGGDPRLLRLTEAALDSLEDGRLSDLMVLAYVAKALAVSGFQPRLTECVVCGSKKADRYSPREGGLICNSCDTGGTMTAGEGADLLIRLIKSRFKEIKEMGAAKTAIEEADKIIWEQIAFHVPAEFKTRRKNKKKGGSI